MLHKTKLLYMCITMLHKTKCIKIATSSCGDWGLCPQHQRSTTSGNPLPKFPDPSLASYLRYFSM